MSFNLLVKVSFDLYDYFPFGGLQEDCLLTARAMQARGHIAEVVYNQSVERLAGDAEYFGALSAAALAYYETEDIYSGVESDAQAFQWCRKAPRLAVLSRNLSVNDKQFN